MHKFESCLAIASEDIYFDRRMSLYFQNKRIKENFKFMYGYYCMTKQFDDYYPSSIPGDLLNLIQTIWKLEAIRLILSRQSEKETKDVHNSIDL